MSDFATFDGVGTSKIVISLHHTDPSKEDIRLFFEKLSNIYNDDEQCRPFQIAYNVTSCEVVVGGIPSLTTFAKTLREFEKMYEEHIKAHTSDIQIIFSSTFVQRLASMLVGGVSLVPVSFVSVKA
jgi:hypothetical protein